MKKVYVKLTAMALVLLLAITVVVSASYAWFVLSDSPEVNGIQVSISGGNTILIAADLTHVGDDGVIYHYPDAFSGSLNFAQHKSYQYLQNVAGLTPISTADGINWFSSTYYGPDDPEVKAGQAVIGQLRPVKDFYRDEFLEFANMDTEDVQTLKQGHYIYMDFWVVSPGSDYKLRISTNDDGGSFVIDMLQPGQKEDGSGYTLTGSVSSAAASVRLGFLANANQVTDNTMLYYQKSHAYKSQYTTLRGVYQEPNGPKVYAQPSYFTIYEPNGDAHPTGKADDGSYVATYPIGLVNGVPTEVPVLDRTTVQLTSQWRTAENGIGTAIEQRFQAALLGMDTEGMDAAQIGKAFYHQYLQGQVAPYVQPGGFIQNTSDLDGFVSAEDLAKLPTAGATDDVYIIELERNVPQRIRMFVWLEGQDVDWDVSAAADSFALNIEFAGSTD